MSLLKPCFIVLLIIVSSDTWARPAGNFYGGIKAGSFISDIKGLDNAYPLGARIGYDYGRQWSLELDYLYGKYPASVNGVEEDLPGNSLGIYVSYRSPGDFYYIIRFGWIDLEIDAAQNFYFEQVDNIDFSYGLGGGIKLTDKISLELDYSFTDSKNSGDVDYAGFTLQRHF